MCGYSGRELHMWVYNQLSAMFKTESVHDYVAVKCEQQQCDREDVVEKSPYDCYGNHSVKDLHARDVIVYGSTGKKMASLKEVVNRLEVLEEKVAAQAQAVPKKCKVV